MCSKGFKAAALLFWPISVVLELRHIYVSQRRVELWSSAVGGIFQWICPLSWDVQHRGQEPGDDVESVEMWECGMTAGVGLGYCSGIFRERVEKGQINIDDGSI